MPIRLTGQSGDSPVLQNVVVQLEAENVDDDLTPARVAHLYPADCTNVMLTMKSMIQGFLSTSSEGSSFRPKVHEEPILIKLAKLEGTKRKSTMSLAVYDIELLKAWYAYNVTEPGKLYLP